MPRPKSHSSSPFGVPSGGGAATPAALAGLVERARDERFRLLATLNDARKATQELISTQGGGAVESVTVLKQASDTSGRLLAALSGLNDRLRERHEQLEAAEARLAARLDVLEATTARRVENEVQRRVETVVVDAEKRLATLATGIAVRLGATLQEAPPPGPRLVEDAA